MLTPRALDLGEQTYDVLDGKIDIITLAVTGDFNAVGKGGEGGMSPTAPAVLL